MANPWGIENQQPPEPVAEPEPVRLSAAHVHLIASTALAVVTLVLYLVDYTSAWDLHLGGYGILVGGFVVCGCGWLVRAAESRVRQSRVDQAAEAAERIDQAERRVTARIDLLHDVIARLVADLPMPGVDRPAAPDVTATRDELRRIVAEELHEQRAQLYAEGYVDGFARRDEGRRPS